MSEAQTLFAALRQSADAEAVSAIEELVSGAPDRQLCRINALDLAAKRGLDQDRVIAAFLHAARLGLFEMSWNVLCPGCGGVLDAGASLKTVHQSEYGCALCAAGYEPTLDEMVEVTFTVSPRVRRIAAHEPAGLPPAEYCRQIFWSSGIDLPDDAFERILEEVTLELIELPPGEKALLSLTLPAEFVIVFDMQLSLRPHTGRRGVAGHGAAAGFLRIVVHLRQQVVGQVRHVDRDVRQAVPEEREEENRRAGDARHAGQA